MGKMQRAKGARIERELVNHIKSLGYPAQRVPLSGATAYAKGDVEVIIKDKKFIIEVKSRKDGFKTIYNYLDSCAANAPTIWILDDICITDSFMGFTQGIRRRINATMPKVSKTSYALMKGANILAVKANNRPFVFLFSMETLIENTLPLP